MSLTSGCILDVFKTSHNNGDIFVQVNEIHSAVEYVISDGEYKCTSRFPKGTQLIVHQRVCIMDCVIPLDKKYIEVRMFNAEEVLPELLGNNLVDVNAYLGTPGPSQAIDVKSQTVIPTAQGQLPKTQLSTDDIDESRCIPFNQLKTAHSCNCLVKGVVLHKDIVHMKNSGKALNIVLQDSEGYELAFVAYDAVADKFCNGININDTIVVKNCSIRVLKDNEINKASIRSVRFKASISNKTTIASAKTPVMSLITQINTFDELLMINPTFSDFHFVCYLKGKGSKQFVNGEVSKPTVTIDVVDASNYSLKVDIFTDRLVDTIEDVHIGDIVLLSKVQIIRKDENNFVGKMSEASEIYKVDTFEAIEDLMGEFKGEYKKEAYDKVVVVQTNKGNNVAKDLSSSRKILSAEPISLPVYLERVKKLALGCSTTVLIRGTFKEVKTDNMSYTGCPDCKKKKGLGVSLCVNCKKMTSSIYFYVVIASLEYEEGGKVFEHWVTFFSNVGEHLFKMAACEMEKKNILERKEVVNRTVIGKNFNLWAKGTHKENNEVNTIITQVN
ncbi:hypothetical protein EIN_176550 [Entamoeba invadens IP1]|uniref:hypothetical protein n=1 Tax=Entamoeba invadens IP1 TaxID=370355 RepID=UPI0002C3D40B|nr:hypothetical protein EIN_176550 [Entamoeba invadens IP1]ELP93828.1 hypothetical protein EIN_176550 [Entamoeba invadens IP1]|eukprot:XP_004260599.1 hypothetical protein EIN_176550 [Entamoeba invadens IP1]